MQAAELVEHLGRDLPAAIRQRIIQRSGGNPFFATELVRSVADRGMSQEPTDLDIVPDTVHGAVLARLDALTPLERSVVQAGSVAARAFRPPMLASLLDTDNLDGISAAIESLIARDIAVPAEGDAYTFRHVLIRDVAYATLSRAERIRMHAAIAAWLEKTSVDRLDEFVELIAYHYKEAVVLSQHARIPLVLPFDSAMAVTFLERAGELASRSGAITEARAHLESAIAIADEAEQGQLYEKLGDYALWSAAASPAYEQALRQWRSGVAPRPFVGARLLRKLLIAHLRWQAFTQHREPGTLVAMLEEGQRLAMGSGDTDEAWRLRVAALYLFLHQCGTEMTPDDIREHETIALDAAAYFQERGDWESFSAALHAYMDLMGTAGVHTAVIEAGKRMLAVPHLQAVDRASALVGIAWAYHALGDHERCIDLAHAILEQRRAEEPLAAISGVLLPACFAAYVSGRWVDLDILLPILEETRLELREDVPSTHLAGGYIVALTLALARDDRAATDAAAAVLKRLAHPGAPIRGMLAAFLADDPGKASLEGIAFPIESMRIFSLMFFIERGIIPPEQLLCYIRDDAQSSHIDVLARSAQIALALEAGNTVQLSALIDDAERAGLIPLAARMRIVLSRMTGNPELLERARPVLERLQDCQSLRRLEEVAAALR